VLPIEPQALQYVVHRIAGSGRAPKIAGVKLRSRVLTASITAATAASAPVAGAQGCADTSLALNAKNASRVEAAVVCLVNAERQKRGRMALTVNGALTNAARAHSRDMARRHYFDHVTPTGRTPTQRIRAAGYKGKFTGENIAYGAGTAGRVMSMWMQSTPHRRNILSANYDAIGVGSANPGDYFTQVFGGN
jgi:uncharacterized protein YkwD